MKISAIVFVMTAQCKQVGEGKPLVRRYAAERGLILLRGALAAARRRS
jgi:hypothetical protein